MEELLEIIGESLARLPGVPRRFAVAFSGGVDSTVLLAALTRLTPRPELRALHVDHGLHPESGAWAEHCRAFAKALGVGYEGRREHVAGDAGESLEAQAREARYRALGELLAPGETLLTAHHRDDQLETLLLRLFRGSGVKGLRGIAEIDRLGDAWLARPMLRVGREEILAAGQAWQLRWLDDPMNRDLRFDRNFLRAEVLPRITERWPAAGRTAGRTARQMAEAQAILDGVAESDAAAIEDPARVSQEDLLALPAPRRRNLLRHLIARLELPVPDARQLDALLAGLAVRRTDAETQVRWPGGEARIYRGRLYLFRPLEAGSGDGCAGAISAFRPWSGPEGRLRLVRAAGPGLPDAWAREGLEVRFRAGGERFQPLRHEHSRPLKKWLQDAGVPPWLRGRIPLLYRDEELVAVGDLWLSAAVADVPDAGPGWEVSWTDHPPLT